MKSAAVEVIKPYVVAREQAKKALAAAFVEDGRTALATLKSRLSLFTNMDASFVLEITVLEQLQGEAGVSLLEKKLMEVLPRAGAGSKDIVSVELALERLIALRESEAYQYVGEQARSSCDILQETLGGMQQGIAPNIEKLKVSPFFRKVIDLLPLMSKCPGTENSSGFSKTLVGVESLAARLKLCVTKGEAGDLAFADLHDLHVFEHWLNEEQRKQVASLTNKLVVSAAGTSADSKGSCVATAAQPSTLPIVAKLPPGKKIKGKQSKAVADDDQTSVLKLFS